MKVIIEKLHDKLGDSYLNEDDVTADVYTNDDNDVIIEVDDVMYRIPNAVFNGILKL